MNPRPYRMAKRGEAAAETRQRIIDAAMTLHHEQGIVATTMRDIAVRADVAIGTVYHHFPEYDELVRACGTRVAEVTRLPTSDVFEGVSTRRARVSVLVSELFAYYDRHPTLWRARCEQDRLPVLAQFVSARDQRIEELVASALGGRDPDLPVVVALINFEVHRSLIGTGITSAQAAAQIADVINRWIQRPRKEPRRAD